MMKCKIKKNFKHAILKKLRKWQTKCNKLVNCKQGENFWQMGSTSKIIIFRAASLETSMEKDLFMFSLKKALRDSGVSSQTIKIIF